MNARTLPASIRAINWIDNCRRRVPAAASEAAAANNKPITGSPKTQPAPAAAPGTGPYILIVKGSRGGT